MSTQRILCGLCKSDLTGPADHDDDSIFRCPVCGQEEKFGDIVKEAHAYMTDVVTRRLDAQLDEITKIHSKSFKVTADNLTRHRGYTASFSTTCLKGAQPTTSHYVPGGPATSFNAAT